MPRRSTERSTTRAGKTRLSQDGIVAAAVTLADQEGLDGLSMRRLAQQLGVDAMSIYYHLHDKDALLAREAGNRWTTSPDGSGLNHKCPVRQRATDRSIWSRLSLSLSS